MSTKNHRQFIGYMMELNPSLRHRKPLPRWAVALAWMVVIAVGLSLLAGGKRVDTSQQVSETVYKLD